MKLFIAALSNSINTSPKHIDAKAHLTVPRINADHARITDRVGYIRSIGTITAFSIKARNSVPSSS